MLCQDSQNKWDTLYFRTTSTQRILTNDKDNKATPNSFSDRLLTSPLLWTSKWQIANPLHINIWCGNEFFNYFNHVSSQIHISMNINNIITYLNDVSNIELGEEEIEKFNAWLLNILEKTGRNLETLNNKPWRWLTNINVFVKFPNWGREKHFTRYIVIRQGTISKERDTFIASVLLYSNKKG